MRVFRIEKHPGDAFWREWHSGWRASVVRTEAEGGDTLFMCHERGWLSLCRELL